MLKIKQMMMMNYDYHNRDLGDQQEEQSKNIGNRNGVLEEMLRSYENGQSDKGGDTKGNTGRNQHHEVY